MIESILLTAARVLTFEGQRPLTNASGFFFERSSKLFLVTSRHVMLDEPSKHFPDRIEIELHDDPVNLSASTCFSILLYRNGKAVWRQGLDSAGEIDVAVIELDRSALPKSATFSAFTPEHLYGPQDHAVIASSFGLRFQGEGYFLTDARTHRGTSGAPVVIRCPQHARLGGLPWKLLGVHSARLDVGTRNIKLDEALGLNCAWYADILLTLTTT
jgi:hypothetical protein